MLNEASNERIIEAEETLKLSYYKGLADTVSLELNGKKLETPVPPTGYRRIGLEYEINMQNIKKILQDGKIDLGPAAENPNTANSTSPAGANANANMATGTNTGNAQ